jgi:hypothetical protein
LQSQPQESQPQERQSLKVFSALKEARPQKMQKETISIALGAAMERVHGVRRVSKVLVEVQEPVVEEILRTLDLS